MGDYISACYEEMLREQIRELREEKARLTTELENERAGRQRDANWGWTGIQACRAKLKDFLLPFGLREGVESPEDCAIRLLQQKSYEIIKLRGLCGLAAKFVKSCVFDKRMLEKASRGEQW